MVVFGIGDGTSQRLRNDPCRFAWNKTEKLQSFFRSESLNLARNVADLLRGHPGVTGSGVNVHVMTIFLLDAGIGTGFDLIARKNFGGWCEGKYECDGTFGVGFYDNNLGNSFG